MVILVFFLVISVNRRLFRYFGSYSDYFGKSSYRTPEQLGCKSFQYFCCQLRPKSIPLKLGGEAVIVTIFDCISLL